MQPAHFEISEEMRQRYGGCQECQFGIRLDNPPWQGGALPLHEQRMIQFRHGMLRFCDCDAGQAYRRAMEKRAEQTEQDDVAAKRAAAASKQRRLERIFSDAHVPDRFANLTLATYAKLAGKEPGRRALIDALKAYYRDGYATIGNERRPGLYVHGAPDTGKTGALSPLFLHYIRQGNSGLWVQYNDLMAAFRDFEGGNVQERIDTCQHVEYLFIDDLGDAWATKSASDYARDVLIRVVDYRYRYNKSTFITSNLAPDVFARQFDERIYRRLNELCAVIHVTGAPMRELMASQAEWPYADSQE